LGEGYEVSPQIPLPRAYLTASGWGIQKIIVNIVDTKLRLLGIDMSKKKKDKKSTVKKIAEAQHRKKQKRKLRLIKTKSKPEPKYVAHPPMAAVDAPQGFRAVSMSQAVMEYSKSIFNFNDPESIGDMNQALQLTSLLWNYGIATESGNVDEKMIKEILDVIQPIWHVEKDEAQNLLDKFATIRNTMFPPDVQIKGSPMMFMRKEMSNLIAAFNYKELELSETVLHPDAKDETPLNHSAVPYWRSSTWFAQYHVGYF